jgi:GAF domain-containing protein
MSTGPNETTSHDRGFESNLIRTFGEICRHACDMIGMDHSGFVRFDNLNQTGEVVAQFPHKAGLIGRRIQLTGVAAEEQLLTSDEPLVIEDVLGSTKLGKVKDILLEFDIRSLCIVKVNFHGIVIGSFSLDSIGKRREFTSEEITLCKSFSELASKTIESAQLVDWMEAFQQATVAITSERESAPLLKTIVKQAELLFSAQGVGLYQRSLDTNNEDSLRLAASSDEDLVGRVLKKGDGMAWQLITSDRPSLTTSNYNEYEHRSTLYEGRFGSVLEVPLLRQSERIGVVYLRDVEGRQFTEFEANLLQRFADVATIALQHCNLLARMKDLSIATTDISGDFDSGTLFERLTAIARHATEILQAEMCGVFRINEQGKLVLEASFGHAGTFSPGRVFEIENGVGTGITGAIAARFIESHNKYLKCKALGRQECPEVKPFNLFGNSLRNDKAVRSLDSPSQTGQCHSLLAIPLITRSAEGEIVTGMLKITNRKGISGIPSDSICFNDEDEWVLRIFAEAVIVALETAKLFDQLKVQKDVYAQLLDTWNTLASEDPLEERLERIAQNLVIILGKSFCRILLAEESDEHLTLKAAAVHPRPISKLPLTWNADRSSRLSVSDWPLLYEALTNGEPYDIDLDNAQPNHETLDRLSALLELRTGPSGTPLQIQRLFSIPMTVGSRPVGLLNVGELRKETQDRGGFTPNQKNFASAVAAQATVMIDREWRGQAIKRREQLLSRLSEALVAIRGETDSRKKLIVIAEQAKSIFQCQLGGLVNQSRPGTAMELLTSSGDALCLVEREDVAPSELHSLLTWEPLLDLDEVSARFGEICNLEPLSQYRLKATLAVRFDYAARSRCVLFVGDNSLASELNSADLSILEKLAHHSSTSLTKAAARDQLTRALDGVNQVAIDLALGDQTHALKNVVEGICSATDSDAVTLYRLTAIDNTIEIKEPPTTTGLLYPEKAARYIRPALESPVGKILSRNELYCADDSLNDEVMAGGFIERERIRSSMGTPIWLPSTVSPVSENAIGDQPKAQTSAAGVLFVNYRIPHIFTEDDKKAIRMFAHLASVAILNQELFEREKSKASTQQALYKAAKAFTESLDLNETVERIAQEAYRVAIACDRRVNFASVALFQGAIAGVVATYPSTELETVRSKLGGEFSLERGIHGRKGVVGRAFQTCVTQIANDVSEDSDPDYIAVHHDTKSQLVVLIWDGKEKIGSINVESSDPKAFHREDEETFEILAALASDAIRNARQFAALEVAAMREESLTDVALFYIKSGVLVHKHRGSVQNFIEWAKILKLQSVQVGVQDKLANEFARFENSAKRLNDLLDSARFDAAELPVQHLNTLMADWKTLLEMDSAYFPITVSFDVSDTVGCMVRIDPDLMREVLSIFSKNALSAMKHTSVKKLTFRTTATTGTTCQIFISDTGHGMDPVTRDRIRKRVRIRTQTTDRTGLGLLTAQLIITKFGGEVADPESDSNGTVFRIQLPIIALQP